MPVLPLSLLPCLVLGPGLFPTEARPLVAPVLAAGPLRAGSAARGSACGERPVPAMAELPPGAAARPPAEHRFWDGENKLLFAWVGAARGLDYSSTLNMRRRGRQEVLLTNDLVDNHAAFAAVEAGGVALSLAVSYLFHHTRHHRLERWTSVVHAGVSTGGAARNYCLKTAHTSPAP